jgi:hypothetical protein
MRRTLQLLHRQLAIHRNAQQHPDAILELPRAPVSVKAGDK